MKPIFLLLSVLLFTNAQAQRIPLIEALKNNQIEVQIFDLGKSPDEKNIEFQIQNLTDEILEILIESGYVLECDTADRQDHVVTQGALIALAPKATVNRAVHGMCIQANQGSPSEGYTYSLREKAFGALEKVVKLIEKQHFQDRTGQQAVWAITNGNPIAGIYDDEDPQKTKALMEFVAEVQGKELPWYNLKYDELESDERVFHNEVSRVDARFKYELPYEAEVTFGIYYADGRELQVYFEDIPRPKGTHTLKFSFEATGLDHGTYYAKMMVDGREIVSRPLEL